MYPKIKFNYEDLFPLRSQKYKLIPIGNFKDKCLFIVFVFCFVPVNVN